MKINSISDIGVKRAENQDNYWSALLNIDGSEVGIVCLCDGMGGLNNGRLASKIVVESVRDAVKDGIPFSGLESVLVQVNKTIYELGVKEEGMMGTTCTLLQCSNGKYEVFHVGDSRCYRVNQSGMTAITTDHSAIVKLGLDKDKDYALWRKYKNSLTRCIGYKNDVMVDYISGDYMFGDCFLVCSDGMWHYFDDYVVKYEDIFDLPSIIHKCIESGETDNITGSILSI